MTAENAPGPGPGPGPGHHSAVRWFGPMQAGRQCVAQARFASGVEARQNGGALPLSLGSARALRWYAAPATLAFGIIFFGLFIF